MDCGRAGPNNQTAPKETAMRRKPIIPMMRLKSSFDLKKLIYDNTPYGLCSFGEVIGVNPMTLADNLNVDIGLIFDFSQY